MELNDNFKSSIKSIDRSTVNKICSGQVVLTLAVAVKELLENSLDAGATCIAIKLKEYGSEVIEVVDNGYGVEEQNFHGLTMKHYTSKISQFQDLESIDTFGFRGEALSSLCALGDVTITTRHQHAPVGTRLRFDHQGAIKESVKIARQMGTTVSIENLFNTLPVRHKEFIRNLKREFGKLCNTLQAYALLNFHCSLTCTNRTGGKCRPFIETRAGTLRENILSIFGPKQLATLLQLQTVAPDEDLRSEFHCLPKSNELDPNVALSGYISSCAHGMGRSAPDRQFFYINSRPVDHSKVMKVVNEIYHHYNPHQYPFVVLNITVATDSVDINVVPDKRLLMLENEALVLATIKSTLISLFLHIPATLPLNNGQLIALPLVNTTHPSPTDLSTVKVESPVNLGRFLAKGATLNMPVTKNTSAVRQVGLDRFLTEKNRRKLSSETEPSFGKKVKLNEELSASEEMVVVDISSTEIKLDTNEVNLLTPSLLDEKPDQAITSPPKIVSPLTESEESNIQTKWQIVKDLAKSRKSAILFDEGISKEEITRRRSVVASVILEEVKLGRGKVRKCCQKTLDVKFFAKIEPSANARAEDELRKELSQAAFMEMQVLGQFNRGFIITRLGPDLFIIDQHATDEKANFEALSSKTVESQRLTLPQTLRLASSTEELLQDRADVVRANGFDFIVNVSAPVTQRVSLTAVPALRGVTLDYKDLDELLFLLADAPEGQMCRPSRVRDVLASRACRMSVMVGTALNVAQMRRLVNRMGELLHPWNCPHGRPTIRHLLNLELLAS